ncbi:MAG: ATP-binding protein [Candidatus Hydrogenedentota bacterium]
MADNRVFYSAEYASTLDVLGDAIEDALTALLENGWIDEDQVFYARLCLEEAVVNAITHGNQSDNSRKVRIEMAHEPAGDICCIRVCDEGPGFQPEKITLPPGAELNGRGVCLIRHCMESVKYDIKSHCLEMRMRRKGLCRGGPTT